MSQIRATLPLLMTLGALMGCELPGGGDTDPTPWPTDLDHDGDGYSADAGDCDDLDLDVGPQAPERCDSADNDCDGLVDEADAVDAPTWFADGDSDGWGSASTSLTWCSPPEGFVADGTDCDDTRADVRPGAPEICDSADNNCDGAIDEGDPEGESPWRPDADGDGYGVDEGTELACSAPEGFVAPTGVVDCDDADPTSHPTATEICDTRDNDCDGQVDEPGAQGAPSWYADLDGDLWGQASTVQVLCAAPQGFVAQPGDCDEGDPTVNPGALERCDDAVDNNCDGAVDEATAEDASAFYADTDDDGYGDGALLVVACEAPPGYVDPNTDCDDGDPAVSPGEDEVCGGPDEDCDGAIDEAGAADAPAWYTDGDGDTYGAGPVTRACLRPEGAVATDDDCDDGDPDVHPGAVEVCATPTDDDCDGQTSTPEAPDALTFHVDADLDGYGAPDGETRLGCEAPAGFATSADDCDDTNDAVNPGAEEVCDDGIDNDCDDSAGACSLRVRSPYDLGDADVKIVSDQAGAYLGEDLAFCGDVNGDGLADLIVGAWAYDAPGVGADSGAAFVFFGPLVDRVDASGRIPLAQADVRLWGERPGDHAGTAVRGAGDLDGDGVDDLIIGSNLGDAGRDNQGVVYVFYGPVEPGARGLGTADARYYGELAGDYAGSFLAPAGDVNGDGRGDVLVGAPGFDAGASLDAGAAYLLYGPLSPGDHNLAEADVRLAGQAAGDGAGHGIAGRGDFNGDGLADILVGAPFNDESGLGEGKAYVLYGPLRRGTRGGLDTLADAVLMGEVLGRGGAGYAVASAGDLNGDGRDDALIGAPTTDPVVGQADNGTAYAVYGPIYGKRALQSPPDVYLDGIHGDDQAGIAVSSAGDIDRDGREDLLVGAWRESSSHPNGGAVRLIFGPELKSDALSSASVVFTGEASGDQAGLALDGGADVNGDGTPDLLFGALGNSEGGAQAGAAYLVLGISR